MRELQFWLEEARRRTAERRLEAIEAACAPHMEEGSRTDLIVRLQDAAMTPEERERRWAAGWDQLRRRLRRKGPST